MKHVIMVMVALLGIVTSSAQAGCKEGGCRNQQTFDGTSLIRSAYHVNVINRANLRSLPTRERTVCNARTGNLMNSIQANDALVCFFHVDRTNQQLVRAVYNGRLRSTNDPFLTAIYLKDARDCGGNLHSCAMDNNGWSLRVTYVLESDNNTISTVYDSTKDGNRYANNNRRTAPDNLVILEEPAPTRVARRNERNRDNLEDVIEDTKNEILSNFFRK